MDNPDSLAVVIDGKEVTYLDFAKSIDAVRKLLKDSQLPPDCVIVNLSSNLFRDWVLLLALRSLGHTTVSADAWGKIEALRLRNIGALVCYAGQSKAIDAFARARPDCPIVKIPLPLNSDLEIGKSPEMIEDGRFGDHILYSTGTTGTYKKVRYSGQVLERCVADPLSGPSARFISSNDVYHATSFGPSTKPGYLHPLVCWFHGATVIFEQRANWTEHFFDYPLTMTTLLAPKLQQLLRSGVSRPSDHPRLRLLVGGGFVNAALAMEAVGRFGCEFFVVYGSTEMRIALESLVRTEEDVIWLTPNSDPDIEIVDEDDRSVAIGEEGVLRIKFSPNHPTGYMDDPEATALHFRNGYFYPGDMAIRRGDGRVRVLGRVADVLNLGGQNHAVGPFEDQARKILQVANLCMFVHQADDGKDILLVAIEGDQFPDEVRLKTVASKFRGFGRVSFTLFGKFPLSDNGMMKINRREVLRLARETKVQREMPVVA